MKRMTMLMVAMLMTAGLLSGCEGARKQDVGVITGAAVGGLLGSQIGGGSGRTVAIIGGAALGGYFGGQIGKSMDDVDRIKMRNALEHTETNKTTTWVNPDSQVKYAVTPTKTTYRQTETATQPCREYTTTANIGGKKEQIYGTACRMDDGSWKVVDR